MALFDFLTSEIAIDLGTANTLIIHKGKIVVDEPSIIALDKNNGKVLAIGHKAMQMRTLLNNACLRSASVRLAAVRPSDLA